MRTRIIEVTQDRDTGFNWGKMLVGEFDDEWEYLSALDQRPLLRGRGWAPNHRLIVDLQTGEGAIFPMSGLAAADLAKRRVWVCPMFEPVLEWMYANPMPLDELPALVELPDAPAAIAGYRRPGSEP